MTLAVSVIGGQTCWAGDISAGADAVAAKGLCHLIWMLVALVICLPDQATKTLHACWLLAGASVSVCSLIRGHIQQQTGCLKAEQHQTISIAFI